MHLTRKMMVKGRERGFKAKRALIKQDRIKLIHSKIILHIFDDEVSNHKICKAPHFEV
ncbi:hypothetical protein NC651_006123 [Populus alba x Populus x berolinensis]|nr:hypothetical protein NC651_006123 [Populus alba x Populus x berolinensis]